MAELKYLDGTGLGQVLSKIKSQLATKSDTSVTTALDARVDGLEDTIDTKAAKATTLAGYGITDAYTKSEIDGKLSGGMHYKGQVDTYEELPSSNQQTGDMYNVVADGHNYVWNGTSWDRMSGEIDLSAYATVSALNSGLAGKVDKVAGKTLTTNDFTTTLKNKLDGIENGAQVNKIESIIVNGVTASISGKQASVTIPMPDTMVALTNTEIDGIIT